MTTLTVLGASGFIGSHLARRLAELGRDPLTPPRGEDLAGADLGDVVYCVGLTADYRSRPLETVEAHVCHLARVLRECRMRSLLYLSSVRLYRAGSSTAAEDDDLVLNPAEPADVYGLSKAMGEALALASGLDVRIARLAHVYGYDPASPNFLASVIREALGGEIVLRTALASSKDYLGIDDTVEALIAILDRGEERIYNVASGTPVTHGEIMRRLADITGCRVRVAPDAPTTRYPPLAVDRLRRLVGTTPSGLLEDLPELVRAYAGAAAASG